MPNPGPLDALQYLFPTGLTDRKLRAIGMVTILWNTIEIDFQELIWTLGDWSPFIGQFITLDLGNVSRIKLAFNLLHSRHKEERLITNAETVIHFYDECRQIRNRLIHGLPVYDDKGELSGRLARLDTKKGTGEMAIKSIDVTDDFLVYLLSDLAACRTGFTGIQQQIRNLKDYKASKRLQKMAPLDDFVYGNVLPFFDIDQLRTRLELLRSQPPSPHNNQGPPLPSQA